MNTPSCLRRGAGSLKHYSYSANGIKLRSKELVLEAISLKVSKVMRKDKIMDKYQKFDYKTNEFVDVAK